MENILLTNEAAVPLSREEEKRLIKAHKKGDARSGHKVIEANYRFVMQQAHRMSGYGLPFEDLVQEGNLGMLKALDKFDISSDYKFITYAVHWIRAYMNNYVFKMLCQVRPFTTQKLRSELFSNRAKFTGKEFSLNIPLGDGGEEFIDLLEDNSDIEENAIDHEIENIVRESIDICTITERHKYLIENRILSNKPMTLEEVGAHFGVTRERARQVEQELLDSVKTLIVENYDKSSMLSIET